MVSFFRTLRALAKGLDLDAAQVESETGVPFAVWQDLMDRQCEQGCGQDAAPQSVG